MKDDVRTKLSSIEEEYREAVTRAAEYNQRVNRLHELTQPSDEESALASEVEMQLARHFGAGKSLQALREAVERRTSEIAGLLEDSDATREG